MTKKRKLFITLLVVAAISSLTLTGCTTTQAKTGSSTTASSQSTAATTDTATYGKVTAVSGSSITLALGTLNQNGGGGTPPDQQQSQPDNSNGSTPPEKPANDGSTADTSSSATPSADGTQGTMPELLTLSGETAAITLSDSITLTKMNNQHPDQQSSSSSANTTATSADITVGSILKITYKTDGTTIDAIEIMTMPQASTTTSSTTV